MKIVAFCFIFYWILLQGACINNKSALVLIMAWHRIGTKPLSKPMNFIERTLFMSSFEFQFHENLFLRVQLRINHLSIYLSIYRLIAIISSSNEMMSRSQAITPCGARPSAGTLLMTKRDKTFSKLHLWQQYRTALRSDADFKMTDEILWIYLCCEVPSKYSKDIIDGMIMSSNGIFCITGLCAGNSPVTGEFPAQRPVTRSFDVFIDLHLNNRLNKQSWGW